MLRQERMAARKWRFMNGERDVRWRGRPGKFSSMGGIKVTGGSDRVDINIPTTIDFVIDYSASMRDILPTVYIFCQDLVNAFQNAGSNLRYGLTRFSDIEKKDSWKDSDFTNAPMDLLNAMQAGVVGGGSRRGGEDVGRAIRFSMNKLSAVPAGERVLLLFTDAIPLDGTDFRWETSLRSAVLFLPVKYTDGEYLFRLTDGQGIPERSKTAYIFNIEDVVENGYLKTADTSGESMGGLSYNMALRNQLLQALL